MMSIAQNWFFFLAGKCLNASGVQERTGRAVGDGESLWAAGDGFDDGDGGRQRRLEAQSQTQVGGQAGRQIRHGIDSRESRSHVGSQCRNEAEITSGAVVLQADNVHLDRRVAGRLQILMEPADGRVQTDGLCRFQSGNQNENFLNFWIFKFSRQKCRRLRLDGRRIEQIVDGLVFLVEWQNDGLFHCASLAPAGRHTGRQNSAKWSRRFRAGPVFINFFKNEINQSNVIKLLIYGRKFPKWNPHQSLFSQLTRWQPWR